MFEKNLKYYRLKKNMTRKELALSIHVTPMTITNYESGKRKPDIEQIEKLAQSLGVHVVDFLEHRNEKLEFRHNEFRKKSILTKNKQECIIESVEEYFSRFFDTIECLGGNPLPQPIRCHCLKETGNAEADAVSLRKYLGLSENGPVKELYSILENRGILLLELDIDDDCFSGMNGFVNNYPYITINKNMRPERKRTTVFHELAYLFFVEDKKSDQSCQEKKATAIAGACLITKEDLIRELGLKKTVLSKDLALVCEEYGISMYLLVLRGNQAGIISSSLATEFFIKANKSNWRKNEPVRIKKPEEPLLFRQLVFRAINEEGIDTKRGAELLKIPCSEIEKYCGQMEVHV